MKTRLLTILIIALTLMCNVDAQGRKATSKRSRTATTAKRSTSRAHNSAQQSPIPTLASLLSDKGPITINSLSDLNKELQWAKSVEERGGGRLIKQPGEAEQYRAAIDKFTAYIAKNPSYNQNFPSEMKGIEICETFINFLILRQINIIIKEMPNEATKEAFKKAMVAMFELQNNYLAYLYDTEKALGTADMGTAGAKEIAGERIGITKATNDFLSSLYEYYIEELTSDAYSDAQEYIEKIQKLLDSVVAKENVSLASDENKRKFVKSANQFLDQSLQWLKVYYDATDDYTSSDLLYLWYDYTKNCFGN